MSTSATPSRFAAWWRFLPFIAFLALGVVFAAQLFDESDELLPSALIDRPAPEFELVNLQPGGPPLSGADLRAGEVTVVNIWASWCAPCRIEHPELMRLSEQHGVTVIGVAYRDKPENSRRMLAELGDPFAKVGVDSDGQAALRWGVSGVPETFVVAGDGTVLYKQGPISNRDLDTKILPAVEAAKAR